jgi:transposase-like protein
MVISLTAKGLTTGEVEAHLAEVYSTTISRETISKITDRVLGELAEWQTRPLDRAWCLGMVANVRERTFGCLAGHTTSCRHRSGSVTLS